MELRVNMTEVEVTFANLPKTTRNKALRPALREGAEVVRKAAVANVKAITSGDSTGTLAKNIVVRSYKIYRGMLRAGVQVKRGAVYANKRDRNGPVRVGLVGAVLEYGKNGQAPQSWIRKAAREEKDTVYAVVRDGIDRRMVQAVKDAR